MKLLSALPPADGTPGSVRVTPEESEDMWHLYNLITAGDRVQAVTIRKVAFDSASGERESERVKLKLTLAVEGVEYDAAASQLRVRGRNQTECDAVKLGAYHSLELELQRPVAIEKAGWDAAHVERLTTACDPSVGADLAAVLVQEGLAHVCLVGGSTTVTKARIEVAMPRKHGAAAAGLDKAVHKFYEQVLQALLRHVDFNTVRCLLLAGPGFTKDALATFLFAEAQKRELRPLLEARTKLVVAHASSGYKHALQEALADPGVAARVKDTKASAEVAALDAFYDMMSTDSSRAFYGPGHVRAAHELGAVHTLLLSDALFRTTDVAQRKAWVDLVDGVRAAGGTAHVFSSGHVSGEQLGQLSGVAAILRFPLPELEDMEL